MIKYPSSVLFAGLVFSSAVGLHTFSATAQEGDQVQTCNASILCQPNYLPQGQTVVRLSFFGLGGTGVLLRNPNPSGNPFVLTAFHVLDNNGNGLLDPDEIATISDSNPNTSNSLVVFEDRSLCGAASVAGPGARPAAYLFGATVRAAVERMILLCSSCAPRPRSRPVTPPCGLPATSKVVRLPSTILEALPNASLLATTPTTRPRAAIFW
jgi:hypothetical protein